MFSERPSRRVIIHLRIVDKCDPACSGPSTSSNPWNADVRTAPSLLQIDSRGASEGSRANIVVEANRRAVDAAEFGQVRANALNLLGRLAEKPASVIDVRVTDHNAFRILKREIQMIPWPENDGKPDERKSDGPIQGKSA